MPSALDLDAFDALAIVSSYRSGAAKAFAETFKQPEGEARRWWKKVTSHSLAQICLKVLTPKAGATKAEYIADYVRLRTHAIYAPWITSAPQGQGFAATCHRPGIELIVAGPLAGELAAWRPSGTYVVIDSRTTRSVNWTSPRYKLDRPPLAKEAESWMLKVAESLWKGGRKEDATFLVKRLSDGSKSPAVRERAEEIIQP